MSNQTISCSYHPNLDASVKCFRCHRHICESDKMLYDDDTYDYGTIRDSCIPCFAVLTEKDAESVFSTVIAYIFLAVWIILTTIIFWPLLIISLFIYSVIRTTRKQKVQLMNESKNKLNSFLETLDPEQRSSFSSIYEIICVQCGSMLSPSDIYCRTCADPIDDDQLQNN